MGKSKTKQIELGYGIIAEVRRNWKVNSKIILGLAGDILGTMFLTWQIFLLNPDLPSGVFWIVLSFALRPYIMSIIILVFRGQRSNLESIIIQQESDNLRLRDISELQIELAAAKPERVEAIKESIYGVTSWNFANKQIEYLNNINKKLDGILKQKKEEKRNDNEN